MGEFVRICGLDEVSPAEPYIHDFDYETVVVFQVGENYFCLEDLCSHQEYPLSDGILEDCRVKCALHGSWFDLRTGEALNLPAVKTVRTFPVKVQDGAIWVAEPFEDWD